MKAILRNHRQAPRKMRVVADIIRGKKVSDALNLLEFTTKKASLPLKKLLKSAVSNVKNATSADEAKLYVKEIKVDGGDILMRRMPRARGMAYPIRKRTSHVTIVLEEKEVNKKEKKPKIKKEDSK